jgi:hypothetical protein
MEYVNCNLCGLDDTKFLLKRKVGLVPLKMNLTCCIQRTFYVRENSKISLFQHWF